MHNCRQVKEQVAELVLDGANRPDEVLSAELRSCAACHAEFEALSATLRITMRLRESAAPAENYWPNYHAKLRQKLVSSENRKFDRSSWLAGFIKSSVAVPVPVVVVLILISVVFITVAVRTKSPQPTPAPAVVYITTEVPVIQERLVTRVVYREKRSNSKSLISAAPVADTLARSQKPRTEDVPASLVGFKPTEEIKLTVIKGGSPNEK
jgi:hypothetical protein